jgi:hypothetical protein
MPVLQDLLAGASGTLVGFVLGLVGGGGSILAVPLLVYVVGVASPHVAIGTSALAVALAALPNLAGHARAGRVKWRCALVFAAAGILGVALGSTLGKALDGERLLLLFGGLMIAIAAVMFVNNSAEGDAGVRLTRETARELLPLLLLYGAGTGVLSGFFGIGGGFLIVPGLMAATGMPLAYAIGSSLVAVAAFGLTTAGSYALSGLIDWRVAAFFIGGGIAGGIIGRWLGAQLSTRSRALPRIFASVVASVGAFVVARGLGLA